ncbi:MAG: glycosyltransferase family 39 protein [Candidatus Micrarchaeaceae archaeon]
MQGQRRKVSKTKRKFKVRGAKNQRRRIVKILPYAVLAAIVIYALWYSVAFVGGPSFYGDDTTYLGLANNVLMGNFQESSYIFSIRLLQIFPIALFYKLFGVSMLSSSAWDILSFIGLITVAFFLGQEIYNKLAGILAALLMAVFPLVVILAPTISDDVPMAFITSLFMLSLLYAERRESRYWYLASGILMIASPLVTPEGAVIIVVGILYIIIELLRRKIKINMASLYFVLGVVLAGCVLLTVNYALTSPHNPFITISLSSHFYSAVGKPDTIPSTDTNPMFYISTMFPYRILSIFLSNIERMQLNPIVIWKQINVVNYNQIGFMFYAAVVAAAYLLIKKEKSLYVPLFWFLVGFLFLEFGPMHVSLFPFEYLLAYRLQRFLTFIAMPTVLLVAIAMARSLERGSKIKWYIGAVVVAASLIFLIATSMHINIFWYNVLSVERYTQLAIANYLSTLPNTTKIYFASAFSNLPIYMKFENLSRFYAYDNIKNCHNIPNSSYVVIPQNISMFNLNYTPHPRSECPSWQLIMNPVYPKPLPSYITTLGKPFNAKLYYVPGPGRPVSTNTSTTSTTITTTAPETPAQYNYFNLTGSGYKNPATGKLEYFVVVNNMTSVNVTLNRTSAKPGEYVTVNVIFTGTFKWYANNATKYYLHAPVINFHYYGVEFANQTGDLYDQSNGPWYYFVSQLGEPHQLLYGNPNTTLLVSWIVTPTENVTGKMIKICGGYFATYQNTTLMGGFGNLYDFLSHNQLHVVNNSAINIQSQKCAYLSVG